jgi:hypothetical protein
MKYNNRKVKYDGLIFDSVKECNRYIELKILIRANRIKDLQTQVTFELVPKQNGERAVKYIADFVYFDNDFQSLVCEDVKGVKTKDYIIKRKLFKSIYKNYKFIES